MVDVGGNNGPARRYFSADKLRRNVLRQSRAKPFARMLATQHFTANALASHVFAQGDKLHFGGDDAQPGVVQLRHTFTRFGAAR